LVGKEVASPADPVPPETIRIDDRSTDVRSNEAWIGSSSKSYTGRAELRRRIELERLGKARAGYADAITAEVESTVARDPSRAVRLTSKAPPA